MAESKQESGTEIMLSWLGIILIILLCCFAVYWVNSQAVHSVIRWIRYSELWLITLVTSDSYSVTMPDGQVINVENLRQIIAKIPSNELSIEKVGYMSRITMWPMKIIFAAIIGLMGLWAYTRGPGTQYTEVFNLDRFIKFQAKNFPIISPFVNFNPSHQPPRAPGSDVPAELPPFAEALGPEEWLAYYQVPIKDKNIDKNGAFRAFARQLGPRWKGYKDLAPYKQIILAACCLKAARKRHESDLMLGRLAKCWSHNKGLQLGKEKGLLKEARQVLNNKDLSYNVLRKCNQHGWQTTVLLRALLSAREEGGVLSPSQFVWLRAHDRELWYPLNNLGRQSNHTEAIGAIAHFKAEKRAQRPIPKPKVQDAVTAIINYMSLDTARPIPNLDYSKSTKTRGIKKLKQA